ncbi:hypothetical protein ECG_05164 [Echinococcus granulosus]|nr:hypothetical protein ECG_05164 [Echinococcus granulosus]
MASCFVIYCHLSTLGDLGNLVEVRSKNHKIISSETVEALTQHLPPTWLSNQGMTFNESSRTSQGGSGIVYQGKQHNCPVPPFFMCGCVRKLALQLSLYRHQFSYSLLHVPCLVGIHSSAISSPFLISCLLCGLFLHPASSMPWKV